MASDNTIHPVLGVSMGMLGKEVSVGVEKHLPGASDRSLLFSVFTGTVHPSAGRDGDQKFLWQDGHDVSTSGVSVRHTERFGRSGTYVEMGLAPVGSGIGVRVGAGVTGYVTKNVEANLGLRAMTNRGVAEQYRAAGVDLGEGLFDVNFGLSYHY